MCCRELLVYFLSLYLNWSTNTNREETSETAFVTKMTKTMHMMNIVKRSSLEIVLVNIEAKACGSEMEFRRLNPRAVSSRCPYE